MRTVSKNWKTWSPFQSPEVREICSHMNDTEKAQVRRQGIGYGVWVVITCAFPLSYAVTDPSRLSIIVAAILVTIHIVCIPFWQKRMKRFLCSTAWARGQGFTPEQIRLYAFRR